MEDIVYKIYDFILYLIEVIKSLVMSVSGKTPEEAPEEVPVEIIE